MSSTNQGLDKTNREEKCSRDKIEENKIRRYNMGICMLKTLLISFVLMACGSGDRTENKLPTTHIQMQINTQTYVEEHGSLSINGKDLVDKNGQSIQLKGMSSHGLQWFGNYANVNAMKELRDNWGQTVFRAAMYTAEGGYLSNLSLKDKVHEVVKAAQDLGIYVVIDWHILSDRNPMWNKDKAKEFFSDMARTYRDSPNVIYEIANEPNGGDVRWSNVIKPYALEVIPEIRKYSDGVIVVGTGTWSQDVHDPASDPLQFQNIMYACHFYAATHGSWLRDRISSAMGKGIAIFVTEWGGMPSSGNGGINYTETSEWLKFMQNNKISWTAWSLSNSRQTHSVLKPWAKNNGGWSDGDISDHGKIIRDDMLKK